MYNNDYGVILYKDLNESLDKVPNKNSVVLNFMISFTKTYYHGDKFFSFCKDVKQNLLHNSNYVQNKSNKEFKVSKIQIDSGDSLSRHNWYYKFTSDYMEENNLDNTSKIPSETKNEMKKKSYERGILQGKEWLIENLDAINLLIPEAHKITEDTELNKGVTTLYKGDRNNPAVEYICYDYWLNHPRYKIVEKILTEICGLEKENGVIQRTLKYEIEHFYNLYCRYHKNKNINKNIFKETSYRYLFDEAVAHLIKYTENKNLIEFYLEGEEYKITKAFKGRKAQNTPIIKKYLQNELRGADQRKFVSVKLAE